MARYSVSLTAVIASDPPPPHPPPPTPRESAVVIASDPSPPPSPRVSSPWHGGIGSFHFPMPVEFKKMLEPYRNLHITEKDIVFQEAELQFLGSISIFLSPTVCVLLLDNLQNVLVFWPFVRLLP